MATRTIADAGGSWPIGGTWVELFAPTAADDCVATATSGNLTGGTGTDACRSLNFTNYVGLFTTGSGRSAVLNIGDATAGAGNIALKMVPGMTFNDILSGPITFNSTSSTQQTITSAGFNLKSIAINGAGSSYLLTDALTCTLFTLTAGAFDTGGNAFTPGTTNGVSITGTSTRSLTLGTSLVTLSRPSSTIWDATTTTNLTFSGSSSTILISDTGGFDKTFIGGGLTYGTIQIAMGGAGAVTFTGSNTFSALQRSGTGTKTIKFTDGTTTTLTGGASAFLSGTSGNLITISGTSTGGWTLSTATDISVDYISIDYCTVTGGGKLYCGTHSTDGGHNGANVVFTDPPSAIPDYRYYSTGRRRRCTYN